MWYSFPQIRPIKTDQHLPITKRHNKTKHNQRLHKVMVNQERSRRTIAPLIRMQALDELARTHAQQMADEDDVHHLNLDALREALEGCNQNRLGVNVQRGTSIRSIHETMMKTLSNKNNIVDRRFTHMGMGTAIGKSGKLYLCRLSQGDP